MPKPKVKSPLEELADQADVALTLCWQRLKAGEIDAETIDKMVKGWRLKRRVFNETQEIKEAKKEAKEREVE